MQRGFKGTHYHLLGQSTPEGYRSSASTPRDGQAATPEKWVPTLSRIPLGIQTRH